MFFTKLSKIGYPFTEKDRAILANQIQKSFQEAFSFDDSSEPKTENKVSKKENKEKMNKKEKTDMIAKLTKEMNNAAMELDFERAMELRDIIFELESE